MKKFVSLHHNNKKQRMMKRNFLACAAMMLLLSSCGGSKQEPSVADEKEDMTETVSNTYSEPESEEVTDLLKAYNEHMDDYSTDVMTALGMGFRDNKVLLNFSVNEDAFDIQNKEALKERVKKMVGDMPMEQKEAWQCIPNMGYELMYTFVGKKSSDIVSVVLTVDDLQMLLYLTKRDGPRVVSFRFYKIFLLSDRQTEDEAGAIRIGGIDYHVATQTARNATGHSEANTCTIVIIVKLDKLIEDMLGLAFGHADSVIFDNETQHLLLLGKA